jgi:hypothetical protein
VRMAQVGPKWLERLTFLGVTFGQGGVVIPASNSIGAQGRGPAELVLLSLAAWTANAVVGILPKPKQGLTPPANPGRGRSGCGATPGLPPDPSPPRPSSHGAAPPWGRKSNSPLPGEGLHRIRHPAGCARDQDRV